MSRYIIAILADEHAGSNLGLCNPQTKFKIEMPQRDPDTGKMRMIKVPWQPEVTPIMQEVWNKYTEGVRKIHKLAGEDPVILLKLGEVCEGTYYANSSMQLKKHYQVKIAVANMQPWKKIKNLKLIRIVPGDRPHEFDEGAAANLVADQLRSKFDNVEVNGHGLMIIRKGKKDEFRIDYGHRGPFIGSRKWLEGNIARLYLKDYMMREVIEFGERPADLVVRGHYHVPTEVDEHITHQHGKYDSKLLVCPCLKFPDAYAKTVTGNKFSATVGTTAIEVVDGKIREVHDSFLMVDTRTWEVVNV